MTVLVGVLCEDGVVLGSDSSATMSGGGPPTVEQPVQKTFIVGDHVIMAGTGQAGLCQRFEDVLSKHRASTKPSYHQQADKFKIVKEICAKAIADFASTHCPSGSFGALVAFQTTAGPHLVEFAVRDFQPEFKTDEQWFASMGSGQALTDPLLAMLRRVFFNHAKPKISEGIFAVTWALQHAIELNPGGINEPMQVGVLEAGGTGSKMMARMLTPEELLEHTSNVEGVEHHIAEYRQILSGRATNGKPVTDPPPPPAAPAVNPAGA